MATVLKVAVEQEIEKHKAEIIKLRRMALTANHSEQAEIYAEAYDRELDILSDCYKDLASAR